MNTANETDLTPTRRAELDTAMRTLSAVAADLLAHLARQAPALAERLARQHAAGGEIVATVRLTPAPALEVCLVLPAEGEALLLGHVRFGDGMVLQ